MEKMSQGCTLNIKFQNLVSFVSLCETCLPDLVFHFCWAQLYPFFYSWTVWRVVFQSQIFHMDEQNISTRMLEAKIASILTQSILFPLLRCREFEDWKGLFDDTDQLIPGSDIASDRV